MLIPKHFDNQIESFDFFSPKPRGLDYSDPGTGKTRIQLDLAYARLHEGKALVIAPKKIVKLAWGNDITKFCPTMRYAIALAPKREQAFNLNADIFITNTDAVTWIALHMFGNKTKGIKPKNPNLLDGFSTLIIDEITAFKHHTSARSKALAKIKHYFKYRYGLTGTPDSNHVTDIWHQAFIIDDGKRLGESFYAFRASTCKPKQVGPDAKHIKWIPHEGIEEAIASLISDITIRHKFEDCHDIPENFVTEIKFDPCKKLKTAYDKLKKTAVLEIQKDAQYVSAVNAAALMTKLMQTASGVVYDEAREGVIIDEERYEILTDLISQRQSCVVFFHWKHQRDLIIQHFLKKKITYGLIDGTTTDIQSNRAVERFQQGLYKVILAHPQAAAHGLTLTRGTSTIWVGPTYNLEHYIQGNKRIYRAGQTKRTETVVIMANDTMDETVYDRLQDKNIKQMNLLNMLQELR